MTATFKEDMKSYIIKGRYGDDTVHVCPNCAKEMPTVDGDSVSAYPAEDGINCDFSQSCGYRPKAN